MESIKQIKIGPVTLAYVQEGEGKPVVLVHGNGEDHRLFRTEIPQLVEAGYRVYAPDSRGHGQSSPVQAYHYAEMAEDVYQFIRALGLEKPAYYGHSDGGIIGLLLALNHPDALGIMAISGTNLMPEGIDASFLEETRRWHEKEPNPLLELMLTEPHIEPESLSTIEIPVLVTAGENDLILREETERIAAHLPQGEMRIVPGADHGSYLDGSPLMGDMLLHFFREHGY